MQQTASKPTIKTASARAASIWNKVAFTGRFGRDPEMHFTPSGKACTKFSIAVNQGKNKDAMWLNVVCWEELAEQVNTHTVKGTEVEIRGRLTQDTWKDRNTGDTRRGFTVVAMEVTILRDGRSGDDFDEKASHMSDDALEDLDEHPF